MAPSSTSAGQVTPSPPTGKSSEWRPRHATDVARLQQYLMSKLQRGTGQNGPAVAPPHFGASGRDGRQPHHPSEPHDCYFFGRLHKQDDVPSALTRNQGQMGDDSWRVR